MIKPLFLLALSLAIAAGQETPAAPTVASSGGATALIITYRCPPPRRAAFRQYLTEFATPRFEHWKQDGVLKSYQFVFSWYVDAETWDAMAVLTFGNSQQVARWTEIEKINPGGLARDALEMAWPVNTYSAEVITQSSADTAQDQSHSVFLVMPYDSAGGEFREYANSYLLPQAKGWMREGILASYSIFVNPYAGGKRWEGLMLVEYKDAEALGRREEVNAKVRTQLRGDAAWRAAGEKHKVTERDAVLAGALLAH